MQLEFFPSRTVTLYIAKMFALRIVAVLAMLVLVLQMLDLLGESGKILEAAGNGESQLWHYVTLVSKLTPAKRSGLPSLSKLQLPCAFTQRRRPSGRRIRYSIE